MSDIGGWCTQPWWRPYSVAWIVVTNGTRASSASRLPATATSQSWPWTRSMSSSSASARPAASMSSFIRRTQAMNCGSSLG